MRTRFLIAMAASILAPSGAAQAQSSPCPANMASYHNLKDGESVKCTCPAVSGNRTVWGTERFTVDSDVCRSAVHAGAAPASGGDVTVHLGEGCPLSRGIAKNGVQSRNFGPYGRTFYFSQEAPACAVQTADDPIVDCPFTMSAFARMKPDQTWRCKCSENRLKSQGGVYGTTRYTTDSSTCHAALHAGAVPPTGGDVTILTGEGCPRYPASQKNGVMSREWGAYAMSFAFVRPLPACGN